LRRGNKEIKDRAVVEGLLRTCPVGRLATNGKDGYPRVKPLNFSYYDGKIYFHSALEGEKIEDIKRDDRVCFETDLPIAYIKARRQPCKADYLYRSVIIKGRASLVSDPEERAAAFRSLLEKYQPEGVAGAYLQEKLGITAIVRIDVQEMTGKEDLGTGEVRDRVLAALENNDPLPLEL